MCCTSSETSNNACSANAGMHYGNDISEFGFESRVEICTALDSTEAVAICEFGEYADVAAVFKLSTYQRICISLG